MWKAWGPGPFRGRAPRPGSPFFLEGDSMMSDTSISPDDLPLPSDDGPADGPVDVSHWWIDLGGTD
jgi:hypothetical protein